MVLPPFDNIVRKCQKRRFNALQLASAIQRLQSDASRSIFQGASGMLQEVERSPNDDEALVRFCNCWIRLANNESFICVIQAAINISNDDLASFLIDEINECIRDIESDDSADKTGAQQMLCHLANLNRDEKVGNKIGEKLLMKYGIPYYQIDNYCERAEDGQLLNDIRSLCLQMGPTGILAVYGMGGIGKSTMVQHLLMKNVNNPDFCKECGIRFIVWLNVQSVGEEKPFLDLLCNSLLNVGLIGNKTDAADLARNEMKLRQRLKGRLNDHCKMLLVLDDADSNVVGSVWNWNSPYVRCIAIARNYDQLRRFCKLNVFLPELATNVVSEMLQHALNDRSTTLSKKEIDDLADRCFGLPIIVSLVVSRLSKGQAPTDTDVKAEYNDLMKLLRKSDASQLSVTRHVDDEHGNLHQTTRISITIGALFQSSFTAKDTDKSLLDKYYGFLFFDKGVSVSSSDLTVLWACDDEEALKVCRRLIGKSLVRVEKQSRNEKETYSVHDLMFDAAVTNAKATGFGDSLKCIRSTKLINAQVLKAAVSSRKRALLERIIKLTEPTHLIRICLDQDAFADGKTFFHFLYSTDWKIKSNLWADTNVSVEILYRLLVALLNDKGDSSTERLSQNRRKLAEMLFLADNAGKRLLAIIKNSSDASFQHRLLEYLALQVLSGQDLIDKEAEEAYWRAEAQRFEEDKLYTAAIQGNDFELMKQQIKSESKEKLNGPRGRGHTLLEVACRNNNCELAEFLLTQEVLVDEKSQQNGWTALMMAAHNGHVKVVQLLINNKADVNEKVEDGWTALMYAAQIGHVDVVQLLINNKADVNEKVEDGWTALMYAALNFHVDVVQLLINNKADVNEKVEDGSTALMLAAGNGHVKVVQLLINNKADVNEKAKDGRTALMIAAENGHEKVVEWLLQSGAKPSKKCVKTATRNGHHHVASILQSRISPSGCLCV